MELFSVSPIIIIACGWLESEEMLQMLQPLISTLHADNRCVVTSTVQYSTVQYSTTYIESIDLLDQGLFLVGSR